MTRSSEHERIALLRALFDPGPGERAITIGIGDDAAVLSEVKGSLAWSIDAAVEGTHFRRDLMTLADVGYRATMAALSDLAAMGADPLGVLSALVLPPDTTDDSLLELARGQQEAAAQSGTLVIGGNLARGDALSITTTVLGRAAHPLTRGGAAPGHAVWVFGDLGWSAAGLRVLEVGASMTPAATRAVARFRRPVAQMKAGRAAVAAGAPPPGGGSRGPGGGLGAPAEERGGGGGVGGGAPPPEPLAALAATLEASWIDLVLGGGEDYALAITAPPDVVPSGFRRIGACVEGPGQVLLRPVAGELRALGPCGFDHFSARP